MLASIDAPWAPVQAVEELLDDPQVIANDYIGEVEIDGGPSYRLPDGASAVRRRRHPSCAGRRSTASTPELILLELGLHWDDIAALQAAGVIP